MIRKTPHRSLWLTVLLLSVACSPPSEEGGQARAASSEEVDSRISAANVYEHEKYWPSIVALTDEWLPSSSAAALQSGYRGVLVRVNEDGNPRIDFGRHGKYDVPIGKTDLVGLANAVREGSEFKNVPNFIRQVGTRLVDSKSDEVRALPSSEVARFHTFLCVFADPADPSLPKLVEQLESLTSENGVQAIFFPQSVGREDMQAVVDRLEALSWQVPFSYPHLTADYTHSILGLDSAIPTLLLVTEEGRVLARVEGADVLDPKEIRKSPRS